MLVLGLSVVPVHAAKIELAIMPGEVIGKHAEFEEECRNCHVPFEREAQSRLCLDCHEDVMSDVKDQRGYHGRLEQAECNTCHTDHKGRGAQIVQLDPETFDHRQTDYLLLGKHENAACEGCHKPDVAHREAPAECIACHRREDEHQGAFGERCLSCHNESGWSNLLFRHDADTEFILLGSHRDVSCTACHKGPLYQQQTPTTCHGCHAGDDEHRRSLGNSCENCHNENAWKDDRFDHATETSFRLLFKHASVSCNTCHIPDSVAENLPRTCFGCHEQDDREKGHQGRYGKQCDTCHDERAFKPSLFRHDRDTGYPLRYRHREVSCDGCHLGATIHEKIGTSCYTCHESDDMEKGHRGFYGKECETCHIEKAFNAIVFDHDRDTSYPLTGRHRQTACKACHEDPPGLVDTDSQCYACHGRDDIHFGTYGRQCDQCHVPANWRNVKENPDKSAFIWGRR